MNIMTTIKMMAKIVFPFLPNLNPGLIFSVIATPNGT
jgi:hypothetical protein